MGAPEKKSQRNPLSEGLGKENKGGTEEVGTLKEKGAKQSLRVRVQDGSAPYLENEERPGKHLAEGTMERKEREVEIYLVASLRNGSRNDKKKKENLDRT